MCTSDCYKWAASQLRRDEIAGKRVLEIGSYDVNGSLRYLVQVLEPAEYIGVDVTEGPGVDIVCPAEQLIERFGADRFDVIVSTCTLEHIRDWRLAVSNMKRLCSPGGIMLVIVPSVWGYHGHPYDFWRFNRSDVREIFADCRVLSLEEDPAPPSNVYAKIQKPRDFSEKDLSGHALHSIVANRRIVELEDAHFRCLHYRKMTARYGAKNFLLRLGRRIFGQL